MLEDYIYSLNIISDVIHLDQLTPERIFNTTDIFILTQMWIDVNLFPKYIIQSDRLIYLNVEMLTELKRVEHVIALVQAEVKMLITVIQT